MNISPLTHPRFLSQKDTDLFLYSEEDVRGENSFGMNKHLCSDYEQSIIKKSQGGAEVARLTHNQEVGGSIPSPATRRRLIKQTGLLFQIEGVGVL